MYFTINLRQTYSQHVVVCTLEIVFVRYYEDYKIDEVKGLSNLTQMYTEVFLSAVLHNWFM